MEQVQRTVPGDVMLSVTSGQNLFEGDPIHFEISGTPDQKMFTKAEPIYAIRGIPGGSGANASIAISELQRDVSAIARQKRIPPFLADSVQTVELLPTLAEMQQMLGKPGSFILTAYAAEDVYPHLGGIPIVAVLTPAAALMTAGRVLGVDPGTGKAGYAVLEADGTALAQGIEALAAPRRAAGGGRRASSDPRPWRSGGERMPGG